MIATGITDIQLSQFRSHQQTHLQIEAKPVVLFGPNGAGKTNILDAISLLAPGRGLRRAAYTQAIKHGSTQPWAIHAKLQHPDGQFDIGTGLENTPSGYRRIVRIDGSNASAGAMARLIRQVWLTPAQDRIFSGPRGLRLKYFDRLVFSLFPEHARMSNIYEKAMRGRQRVLDDGASEPAWLDGLEQQMAEAGAKIILNRAQTLRQLSKQIQDGSKSAFPKADLSLGGADVLAHLDTADEGKLHSLLQAKFQEQRPLDTRAGRALAGPHRGDLLVRWAAKDMAAGDCSTGEQKALLVGMTLAHARAVTADKNAAPPLILLDEACAHLDAERRAALIEELCALKGQAWLSGTDQNLFEAFGARAHFFEVSETETRPV